MADVLGEIEHFARAHQIPVPPIPAICSVGLARVDDATWISEPALRSLSQPGPHGEKIGQGNTAMNLYFFNPWLPGFLENGAAGDFAFGVAGHGVNSYAITLRMAVPGMVVALQAAWPGAYTSWSQARPDIRSMITTAEQCLQWVEANHPSRRMAVVVSSLRGIGLLGWQDHVLPIVQAQQEGVPFRQAMQAPPLRRWEDVAVQLHTFGRLRPY
ncbi:MAG TPA: hypothetical protein VKU92_09320 [Acidimicrobiales bacterium]|nr:hypothetical protein [Acidimicrobiales bacterium]